MNQLFHGDCCSIFCLLKILGAGIAIALLGMITSQATTILIEQSIPDADK
ncbi:MAG: hypothetical protein AAF757_25235 [Cyanobacteria bacterium P01_D01_bin.116]